MSSQAIETDDNIESEELEVVDTDAPQVEDDPNQVDAEAPAPEDEEEDIVVAGEEEPTSRPVHRPDGIKKRISKLTGKVEAANSEAESERLRADAAVEESRMWRLQATQGDASAPPKADDFDTDAEFDAANKAFEDKRVASLVAVEAKKLFDQQQGSATQRQTDQHQEQAAQDHIDRATKLKVKDYDAVEDVAMETLGENLTKTIVANSPKSELLFYYLGKNPGAAEKIRRLAETNDHVKCVLEIGRLEQSLKVQSKSKVPPDPERTIAGGKSSHSGRGPAGATFE